MQQRQSLTNWGLFALLSFVWASAYAFTRLAVSRDAPEVGFPPEFIIPGRILMGAIILHIVAYLSGQKWPPLKDGQSWLAMLIMGLIGTAAPFFVITTAQKTVDSSLAALYVAASPLFVSILAHILFSDDKITLNKSIGLLVGFAGVGVLFGPDAIKSFGSASVMAQALCLLGTVFYAISTITARWARHIPPFIFSAGFLTFGGIGTLPLLLRVDFAALEPSASAIGGLLGLAMGPTALASIVYMILIARTRASFVSLTGYTIPVISAFIGYLVFGEVQRWNAVLAFALILGGVWITQRNTRLMMAKA